MFTGQHQMISCDRILPFYIFFCYREHILYQKRTFTTIIQLYYMKNIARFPCFLKSCFLHLHTLIMEKVLRLTAKDYTFNPTIYIPHIGQR